jgi:hypothetical protein
MKYRHLLIVISLTIVYSVLTFILSFAAHVRRLYFAAIGLLAPFFFNRTKNVPYDNK